MKMLGIESSSKINAFDGGSSNVVTALRKCLIEETEGGSNCVSFANGCSCHTLPRFMEDILKHRVCAGIMRRGNALAKYFQYIHLASQKMEVEKHKPSIVKSFSKTRWGDSAVMLRSLIQKKVPMTGVFSRYRLRTPSTKLLNVLTCDNAALAEKSAEDADFWEQAASLAPFLKRLLLLSHFWRVTVVLFQVCHTHFRFYKMKRTSSSPSSEHYWCGFCGRS